ncbi:hypothetical protein ACQCN2_14670 [Brevibacillus ginsengisoli]|uniref:hypothetical protein n=1 Tax=Brevibacillus ginsengisoli TaxID=363854 RepID=UPI003CF308EF
MTRVSITFENTVENQDICRQIRRYHKKLEQPLLITFRDEATEIVLEAAILYIPDKKLLPKDATINGLVKKTTTHYEIHPRSKSKTINLHLDSELVAELEQIRQHVQSKTQHDVILEMFIRGMRAYRREQE